MKKAQNKKYLTITGICVMIVGCLSCSAAQDKQAATIAINDAICLLDTYEVDSLNGMGDVEAIADAALKCAVQQNVAKQILGAHIANEQKRGIVTRPTTNSSAGAK